MKILNKENEIEHTIAMFAHELLIRFGKTTAVSDEGIQKLVDGCIIQINEKNPALLGTNWFHVDLVIGMVQKYHVMQFYNDNIKELIEDMP